MKAYFVSIIFNNTRQFASREIYENEALIQIILALYEYNECGNDWSMDLI